MPDFRVHIGGAYKGRSYNLEFGLPRKPRRSIELDIPNTQYTFTVKAAKGRSMGDSPEGTPCTAADGRPKWQAPATYREVGGEGIVTIGVSDAPVSD